MIGLNKKCNCEEPIILLDENHLFEMCYKCNTIRELTNLDMWIKDNLKRILEEL